MPQPYLQGPDGCGGQERPPDCCHQPEQLQGRLSLAAVFAGVGPAVAVAAGQRRSCLAAPAVAPPGAHANYLDCDVCHPPPTWLPADCWRQLVCVPKPLPRPVSCSTVLPLCCASQTTCLLSAAVMVVVPTRLPKPCAKCSTLHSRSEHALKQPPGCASQRLQDGRRIPPSCAAARRR